LALWRYGRFILQALLAHKRPGSLKKVWVKSYWPKVSGYAFAVFGVAAVTAVLDPFHERLSSATVSDDFHREVSGLIDRELAAVTKEHSELKSESR
jgi:hypothetical protein